MTTKYIVELTEDEAIALVMLPASGVEHNQSFVGDIIRDIASALEKADPQLNVKQYDMWEDFGRPSYSLVSIREPT
jgi:hypothetical protein